MQDERENINDSHYKKNHSSYCFYIDTWVICEQFKCHSKHHHDACQYAA